MRKATYIQIEKQTKISEFRQTNKQTEILQYDASKILQYKKTTLTVKTEKAIDVPKTNENGM